MQDLSALRSEREPSDAPAPRPEPAEYKRALPPAPAAPPRRRASTVPGIIDAPARPSQMQAKGSPAQPAGGAPGAAPPQPGAPMLGSYSYQAYPEPYRAEMPEKLVTTGKLPQRKPSRHWLAFWLILMLAALIAALVWWMA